MHVASPLIPFLPVAILPFVSRRQAWDRQQRAVERFEQRHISSQEAAEEGKEDPMVGGGRVGSKESRVRGQGLRHLTGGRKQRREAADSKERKGAAVGPWSLGSAGWA